MNTEISAIMDQSGRVLDWANAVKYSPAELSAEDKEISAVTDAWVKELGKTGFDKDHELSALVTKTFTPDTVSAPSELIDMLFDNDSIGEFGEHHRSIRRNHRRQRTAFVHRLQGSEAELLPSAG